MKDTELFRKHLENLKTQRQARALTALTDNEISADAVSDAREARLLTVLIADIGLLDKSPDAFIEEHFK